MVRRLKGIKVSAKTFQGRRALKVSFDQERTATNKELGIYLGFWRVERDNGNATFYFRNSALVALGATQFKSAGKVRKDFEKNIEQVEVQFHEMMLSCGAKKKDYNITPVWKGDL